MCLRATQQIGSLSRRAHKYVTTPTLSKSTAAFSRWRPTWPMIEWTVLGMTNVKVLIFIIGFATVQYIGPVCMSLSVEPSITHPREER